MNRKTKLILTLIGRFLGVIGWLVFIPYMVYLSDSSIKWLWYPICGCMAVFLTYNGWKDLKKYLEGE